METYNNIVLDKIVRHQIQLLRLANGFTRDVVAQLKRAQQALFNQIANLTILAGTSDRELQVRMQVANTLITQFYTQVRNKLTSELGDVYDYEIDWTIHTLQTTLPADVNLTFDRPSEAQIIAASLLPVQGRTVNEWFADMSQTAFNRALKIVRQSFIDGDTVQEIAKQVRDAFAIDARAASAISRTLVMASASQARNLVYKENDDLIKEILWVSTLDNRTTPICISLDGQVFPVDDGPRPPAHINCRSTTTPIVKGASALGLPPATRASMDGQVPEDMTYGQWLRKQPAAVQDEVLGPTRGKLFRSGDADVDRFINDEGQFYTLSELRRRDPQIFSDAEDKP